MSVVHDTFVVSKAYAVGPERAFAAWSDPERKAAWFLGGEGFSDERHELDFRVGGVETKTARAADGIRHRYAAVFADIVPCERIVFGYDMHLDDRRISVSLVTVEFRSSGDGTQLTLTEQGAFLDGLDEPAVRAGGFGALLDALGGVLPR